VLFRVENNIAHITLNRPDNANALDEALARDLAGAALDCARDPSVRAVILDGAGKMFCGGGDLAAFAAAEDAGRALHAVTDHLHVAITHLTRLDAPVIAAVHGSAAGAGLPLACLCDIVIAARSAKFVMAYTRAGLTPDGSSTWFLPRLIGLRRAQEMVLLNRVLSAEEACDWGLITRVVDDGQLADQSYALAEQLAAGPTKAFGTAKRLLIAAATRDLEAQLVAEAYGIGAAADSPDGQEGMHAFLEKRRPKFTGA